MTDLQTLLNYLIEFGGSIVSSNSLKPEWINQARASERMWVDENGYGFIWEPEIKGLPVNKEELAWFERWYPLDVDLPDDLKNLDIAKMVIERNLINRQKKEN